MKTKQLYRLKEEAKQYFATTFPKDEMPKMEWFEVGVSIDALEPVEPNKIVVHWVTTLQGLIFLNDNNGSSYKPNEEEMQDIERLINLGGFEGIFDLLRERGNEINKTNKYISFEDWLKEKGL